MEKNFLGEGGGHGSCGETQILHTHTKVTNTGMKDLLLKFVNEVFNQNNWKYVFICYVKKD